MTWQGLLLLSPVFIPALGGVLTGVLRIRNSKIRNTISVTSSLLALLATSTIFILWLRGYELTRIYGGLLGQGLSFRATGLGAGLATLAALIWFLAVLYSLIYMRYEHSPSRFFAFLLISQAGCLGVFLAGDYLTLFLLFEIMTFSAYPLIIHEEDAHAMSAGNSYLYLSVAGGLVLLFGILLLVWVSGTGEIAPALSSFAGSPNALYWLAFAFIAGFGVKAGLVPLHVWLPRAHPVAPTPASALLSGIMIKTGAYGIIRFLTVTLAPLPGKDLPASLLNVPKTIGFVLAFVALATMLAGAIMALRQDSMKKVLAYSSVSQMGYIILPAALAAYLGDQGGLAYVGSVFHLFNHAVFKAGLFMMVGAVYLLTHSLSMKELGGMRKVLPFTAITTFIASLAVLGMPGFSGFASKTVIHDALLIAAHDTNVIWIGLAEKLFILGSALTAAYFIKLYRGIFLGKYRGEVKTQSSEHPLVKWVLASFAALILVVGIKPYWFMDAVVRVAASDLPLYQHHLPEQLHHIHFWYKGAYWGVLLPALMGIAIYFVAEKGRFDLWQPPAWMSVENLVYIPVSKGFLFICSRYVCGIEGGIADVYDHSSQVSGRILARVNQIEGGIADVYDQSSSLSERILSKVNAMEGKADAGVSASAKVGPNSDVVPNVGNGADHHNGKGIDRSWSPQNITLGSLLLAIVLLIIMFILYFFGGAVL